MEGYMQAMCNFGEAVEYYAEQKGYERGYQLGVEEATLSNLRSLQNSTGWPLQQAMDALSVSKDDQEKYSKMLRAEAYSHKMEQMWPSNLHKILGRFPAVTVQINKLAGKTLDDSFSDKSGALSNGNMISDLERCAGIWCGDFHNCPVMSIYW